MNRPLNPLKHGLKTPQKVYLENKSFSLKSLDDNNSNKISLSKLVDVWNDMSKVLTNKGARLTEGPLIDFSGYHAYELKIIYSYELENTNFEMEKADFDAQLREYEEDLKNFEVWEKEKLSEPKPSNIDRKIERAEKRLANLKAVKAGEPLPFPEG